LNIEYKLKKMIKFILI